MAVRSENIQVRIDFITDEGKQFAKAILDTQAFNKEIATSQAKLKEYQKQLQDTSLTEEKRATILQKVANEEQAVANNLAAIVRESQKVAGINLNNLTPAQLVARAKELEIAIRSIPTSAPEFKLLTGELTNVNTKLRDIRNQAKGIQDDGKANGGPGGILGSVVGRVAVFASVIGGIIATLQGVFSFVSTAIADFSAGEKADRALQSRIESTGGAAGRTLEQLKQQAGELQKVTLFPDDVTEKGQEILLTFTNIREEIFDRTIPLAQDLSTVFEQDLATSAVQLGKALNDPVKGISALQRVGITFSEDQKKLIESLVATGDVAAAQTVILNELEVQVGGAARAAAEAGLGPYELLRQRFDEVKEAVGGLILQGLSRLRPVIEQIIVFFEGLTEALVSGEQATGQYSTAINIVVRVLQLAGQLIEFQINLLQRAADQWTNFVDAVRQAPIIGTIVENFIITPLRLVYDAFLNLPATWAGVVAALKQGAENLYITFRNIVLQAEIFAKEIDLALTIRQDTKDRLTRELGDLRARQAAAQAGKSIGDAYTEARNKALGEGAKGAGAAAGSPAGPKSPFSIGGLSEEDLQKRRDNLLENELKAVEAAALRREIVAENARLKDELNETAYQNRLIEIKKQKLQEQLDVYRKFKQDETTEALKVQNELLRLEAETRRSGGIAPLQALGGQGIPGVSSQTAGGNRQQQVLDAGTAILEQHLRDKFARGLLLEEEYELAKLELKRQGLEMELEILRSATQPQVDEIRKREEEKAKVEEDLIQRRLDAAIRAEELKRNVAQAAFGATNDLVSATIELISLEEASRKKNASLIKNFQIGQVFASGVAEVAQIWEKAAAFGPLQAVIAGLQTTAAIFRTTTAIRKIEQLKFGGGGLLKAARGVLGVFGGRPHSQGGTKGYFDDGTQIEVERDEAFAVINKRNTPMLKFLSAVNSFGGNGVPFMRQGGMLRFAGGGLPDINTTPSASFVPGAAAAGSMESIERLNDVVTSLVVAVAQFPRSVKADVVYTDIEDVGSELNRIRNESAL
jgi:hypothetical protein